MPAILLIVLAAVAAWLLGGLMNRPNTPQPPAPSPQIAALAAAIAVAEGSDPDWNNPGDLTISFGYPTNGVANSAGVLKFANGTDGWNALYRQLSAIVNGTSRYTLDTTLAAFGLGYSGGDPNWAKNVGNELGVSPDTTLGDILT